MSALVISDRPSPNRACRPAATTIDTLVLHYTGMADGAVATARLRDPLSGVSAHYVVEIDGTVSRLVEEEAVAWHAGVSAWRGRQYLNPNSIGIEIVNGGHDFGLPDYPDVQIDAVIALAGRVVRRWSIPACGIVAHSDVAPMRKEDPGEHFPWSRLAAAGIGLWPDVGSRPEIGVGEAAAGVNVTSVLMRIGYALDDAPQPTTVSAALRAFQRRFLPDGPLDGRADASTRCRLLEVEAAYRLAPTD